MTSPADKSFRYQNDYDKPTTEDNDYLEWFLDGLQDQVESDGVSKTLASGRPSNPDEGKLTYDTDTNTLRIWSGTEWQEIVDMDGWTTWVPTLVSGATIGNGGLTGKYRLDGYTFHFWFKFELGTTSSMATNPKFNVPSGMGIDASSGVNIHLFHAVAKDNSAGTFWSGSAIAGDASDDVITTRVIFGSSTVTATSPFTWANGDWLIVQGTILMDDVNFPTS